MRARTRTALAVAAALTAAGPAVAQTPVAPPPRLVAAPDADGPSVRVGMVVAKVPAAFLADCGLTRPGTADAAWVLTEREFALFNTAFRNYPKREVYSRPTFDVRDNQTGFVRVGQDFAAGAGRPDVWVGVTARVTPRVAADGKSVLLRAEMQCTAPSPGLGVQTAGAFVPGFNTQAVQTTVSVPTGGTAVVAVPVTGDNGEPAAVLFILTPTVRP